MRLVAAAVSLALFAAPMAHADGLGNFLSRLTGGSGQTMGSDYGYAPAVPQQYGQYGQYGQQQYGQQQDGQPQDYGENGSAYPQASGNPQGGFAQDKAYAEDAEQQAARDRNNMLVSWYNPATGNGGSVQGQGGYTNGEMQGEFCKTVIEHIRINGRRMQNRGMVCFNAE
jgi:hypothetical protein